MHLLLINYEFPPLGGGAANATKHLAGKLAGLGHEVTVLTSAYGDLPRQEVIAGFTVKRITTPRRHKDRCTVAEMSAFMIGSIPAALRQAAICRPDVACAFFGLPCGPAALALKKTFGVPYVVSLRGGDVPGFQPYDLALYHKLTRPVIAGIWRQASAVVANSRGLQQLARDAAPDVAIDLIPNGVDLPLRGVAGPRAGTDASLDAQHDKWIAFSGRLVEQKGLTYLIEALPGIARAVPGVRLKLIGDGPLRPRLEALARELGVAERLTITGWATREQVLEHLRQATVFMLPSLDEGMSNALLEALAGGLPAVATNISGNEELVEPGGNGWLIPTRDTAAIERAVTSILTDNAMRQRMGAASLALAERYAWSRAAAAYLTLFERAQRTPAAAWREAGALVSTSLEDPT
ncbi:MAG TPA: glycosyltransferase family 4 protein [Chloroflexota bacterium]|nr:glycosyltransferase family 4 protein [Chloroflexota bacterium]